jgi:hypothetical protein
MREIQKGFHQNNRVSFLLAINKQKNIYWEVPVIDETKFA